MVLRGLATALVLLGPAFAHSDPGELDATFGSGGYDSVSLPAACIPGTVCWIKASSTAMQPDGRIVIAANFRYRNGGLSSDNQVVLYRRLPNGGPDPAFGDNGIAIPFPLGCAGPIALQPDGKIIAGVGFRTFYGSCFADLSTSPAYGLARFGTDGALDPTFGASGVARIDEGVIRYGALTNGQFVSLVYENVLGRAPDAPGLAFWTGQVDGGMTRGQMMVAFSESPEYRASINTEVYVTMMYTRMLRREPDAGGFRFWTGFMDAGNPGIALIDGFLASTEYRRRFLP